MAASEQQQRVPVVGCPSCHETRHGLSHAWDCWSQFQRDLAEREPRIASLIFGGGRDGLPHELWLIFTELTNRIRDCVPSDDFARHDKLVALRLDDALAHARRTMRKIEVKRPRLVIVQNAA